MRFIFAVVGFVIFHSTAWAQQPVTGRSENVGPNASILRWAEGKYLYLTADGARQRGMEQFRMNVHPDGTRTMIMWHDLFARNSQYTVVLRVAPNFRPLEAYTSYWTGAGYKGSAMITVTANALEIMSTGPLGPITQSITVPEKFSIGSHPVAADGWHTWYGDVSAKGVQKDGQVYGMDVSADLTKPILGQLHPHEFEIIGQEKITVPAGTFEATKYRLGGSPEGAVEMWVATEDRIMIRTLIAARRADYVLEEFKSGNNAKK